MTTGESLLHAVLDDPQDDAVRLVYADFLEENGDLDRSEFIRVQCEMASLVLYTRRTPGGLIAYEVRNEDAERYEVLQARERELLALPLAPQSAVFAWSQPIHQTGLAIGKPWPKVFSFRRGFVDSVSCTSRDFVRHAKALFSAHPIERVIITEFAHWSVRSEAAKLHQFECTLSGYIFSFSADGIHLINPELPRLNHPHYDRLNHPDFDADTSKACLRFGKWMRDQPEPNVYSSDALQSVS